MAKCGASVVVAGRSAAPLDDTVDELRALGATGDRRADRRHRARRMSSGWSRPRSSEFGAIDCWVNNAGSANAADVGPLIDLDEQQWDAVVDLNLKWTFFAAQAAARTMIGRGGSIVNISSRSGSQPCPMTGQYGAAKAGVDSLTATMAAEWGHHGIRVNGVAPGLVPTEESIAAGGSMSRPSRVARQVANVPLRRLGTVDDIGAVCAFLASDEASWMTGEVIQVTAAAASRSGTSRTCITSRNNSPTSRRLRTTPPGAGSPGS